MNSKRVMTTSQLAVSAMLAALCAVLGYISLDLVVVKVTFESFPVIMAALMYGPLSGALVGAVGTLIYQMLRYGLSYTTLLWMLPYIAAGAAAGAYAKKHNFSNSSGQILFMVIVSELIITALNTVAIYADSRIYGYYFPGIVTGNLLVRCFITAVRAFVFGLIMPKLLIKMSRITHNGQNI